MKNNKKQNRNSYDVLSERGELEGRIEFLPIQEWFMKNGMKNKNHVNHSFLIHVKKKIDKARLEKALEGLNKQHDMLRTVYSQGTQSYQKDSKIVKIQELNISGKSEEEIYEELTSWQNGFDIEKGYLWQSGIINGYEDGSERIFFAAHHLIFDAASWKIIREDLKELYYGKELGEKGSSYRQWAEAVKAYGKKASEEEKKYWKEIDIAQYKQQIKWEKLNKGAGEKREALIEFGADITSKLLQVSQATYSCELSDLLLSGFVYALHELSGEDQIWLTLECPGREMISNQLDISRTVGWFTTMYPVELKVGKDVRETITETQKRIRRVPHNGIGYGAIHGYDKLPACLFNYVEDVGGPVTGDWEIRMAEQSGESMSRDNRSGNIVDLNGVKVAGTIIFLLESCLSEENHRRLCEAFKSNVAAIASHVLNQV